MADDQEPTIQTAPQTTGAPSGSQPVGALNPPATPVETNSEDAQSGNQEQGIKPSRWDSLVTSLQQAWENGPTAEAAGYANQKLTGAMDKGLGVANISPDEANKQFPGMPEPFTTPVDPNVAKLQYDAFKNKQHLQDWAIRGGADPSKDFWGPIPVTPHGFQDFSAGLAEGFVDPINLALNAATFGLSKAAGMTNSIRNVILQNVAISSGLGAMDYGIQKSEHMNPSVGDTAKGAVFSAIGGTLFHMGLQKLWPADLQESALRTAIMQHEAGANIDVTPQALESHARATGEMNGQESPYRFLPVDHPSERTYYMAQREGETLHLNDHGPGTYAVDNGMVANNAAAATDGKGYVGEHIPDKETKFLNLDESLPKEIIDQAQAELKKAGLDSMFSRSQLEDASGEDVLNLMKQIPPEEDGYNASEVMQKRIEGEGYDGLKYTAKDDQGNPTHNGIVLFDDKKAIPSQVYQSNPEISPTIPESDKQAFAESSTSQQASQDRTPELEKQIHDLKHGPSFNSTPEYMDPIVSEQYQQAKAQLQKLSETSPTAKDALETIRRSEATGKQELEMMKQIADCAGSIA